MKKMTKSSHCSTGNMASVGWDLSHIMARRIALGT